MRISYEQFFFLVKQVELSHKERQAETERQKVRLNARGGGRKPKLTIPKEVCLSLFYLRQMPTFEVLGIYFNLGCE
ncbi:transposase family protein [Chroococcidiopsis sp. CCNUC1]|uniref:transposase family protein n=1 Tax=Chroococcidiopsis sp. CCNUC1 TaxID=2653189 RepID=UPI00201FFDC8|nr:transposase family protein [Chroococcidiopsis sp. CCNUC1]URD53886.1 transposase family protein [Chroococcidiopsis sp. CCNUC1]